MAKLNFEKLSKADFFSRFLGFMERYDDVNCTSFYNYAKKWVLEKDITNIQNFLDTWSIEYSLSFSKQDFISMTPGQFAHYQEVYTKVCALLDEKKSLHQELLSFYE